jgi:hypothetical protein
MSGEEGAGGEAGIEGFAVLSPEEENALAALRLAVAGIREGGGVADAASIVRAVLEAGGAAEEARPADGRPVFRLGSARFAVDARPAAGGRLEIDFDPPSA